MRRAQWLSFGFLALLLLCNSARAEQIRFKADLAAPPGITSSGKGTATASLDTTTKLLSWTVDYSGLSGPATAAHIHGPADPGANAGIVVLAEMPGVSTDGVDISLERRVLTIRGHSAANEHGGYQRVYNEYADGDYERVFTLSENIDRDRIEATLKDGVLQLVLPKAEAAKARKIELKSS